jgi:hypothetical protein
MTSSTASHTCGIQSEAWFSLSARQGRAGVPRQVVPPHSSSGTAQLLVLLYMCMCAGMHGCVSAHRCRHSVSYRGRRRSFCWHAKHDSRDRGGSSSKNKNNASAKAFSCGHYGTICQAAIHCLPYARTHTLSLHLPPSLRLSTHLPSDCRDLRSEVSPTWRATLMPWCSKHPSSGGLHWGSSAGTQSIHCGFFFPPSRMLLCRGPVAGRAHLSMVLHHR